MCGLAGLACLDPTCRSDHAALVTAMCQIQAHRGPDDQGVAPIDHVCLGSRRLAIIDVSPAGHMPMSDPTGRRWIAYNGEVYNFRELRTELEQLGHAFVSHTDTEVILHAWMEWGNAAFDRLVGMFAVAVMDRDSGILTLARDRYGIKPLYYTRVNGHLLFASEIKALRTGMDRVRVNGQRLAEWFLYRNTDSFRPETLIEDVCSVLPGHTLTIAGSEVRSAAYYNVTAHVSAEATRRYERMDLKAIVAEVDGTLREAVRSRLVADVPVGTLCSGGLDSSLVTAIAGEYTTDITAFHVSVADAPELDERQFAEQLTQKLGIPLVSYTLTADSFRSALPRAVYHSDVPLTHPNSVAYLHISQVARAHGVVVLLSGEGADELFGGYSWGYRRFRTLERLKRLVHRLPRKLVDQLILLAYASADLPATAHRFRDALPSTVAAIDGFARLESLAECEEAYGFVADPADRAVLARMLADLSDFLAPLLRRLDRMSMAASVEARVPFLDHRLVHQVINLPLAQRIGQREDKWLLKKVAERYLPQGNIWRPKMGFPLPLAAYIRPFADFRFFADGYCANGLGLGRTGLRQYIDQADANPFAFFGLLSLEMWGRMMIMGQAIGEVEERFGIAPSTAPAATAPAELQAAVRAPA